MENTEPQPLTPAEFLARFPGAPTKERIADLKAQVPGGRIRLFSPDDKRVYLLRGISPLELATLQNKLPANLTPQTDPAKYEQELQYLVVAHCTVWTSTTATGKLTDLDLKNRGAGLVGSLQQVIDQVSDFLAPVEILRMSADL